jgi:hypothetical protein
MPMFFVDIDGIFCYACKYYLSDLRNNDKKNRRNHYITVGARPDRKESLNNHICGKSHCRLYPNYIKKVKEENHFLNSDTSKPISFPTPIANSTSSSIFKSHEKESVKQETESTLLDDSLLEIIKDKMTVIIWMIKANISNSQFWSLQQLIDCVGNNELLKTFEHSSDRSFLEFLTHVYVCYKEMLIQSIKNYKYYSIMVDDSVDVNGLNQMSVYIRYLDENIKLQTSFLSICEIGEEGATAKNLCKILKCVLDEYELDIKNMVGFTSDGASNMRGDIGGLCELLKKEVPEIIDCHCFVHRFNLVMKDSLKKLVSLNNTKEILSDMSTYINRSSNRISSFHNIQKKIYPNQNVTEILDSNDTRWSSCFSSIHSIMNTFLAVVSFFEKECKEEETEKVKRLFEKCCDLSFIQNSTVLNNVLCETNKTIINLQYHQLSVGDAMKIINNTHSNLQLFKNEDSIKKIYSTLPNKKTDSDSGDTAQSILILKEKVNTLVDCICENMNSRYKDGGVISDIMSVFSPEELKKINNDNYKHYCENFGRIVEFFKTKFIPKKYEEKEQDWRIFNEEIKQHLFKMECVADVCNYILCNHRFAVCDTLLKIAQIALLIPNHGGSRSWF